jgi:hypothetical protein
MHRRHAAFLPIIAKLSGQDRCPPPPVAAPDRAEGNRAVFFGEFLAALLTRIGCGRADLTRR